MGKAARWLKGVFGMKKEKENVDNRNSNSGEKGGKKKRWSLLKTGVDNYGGIPTPVHAPAVISSSWLKSFIADSEEQRKHAIAVAAATAAAADAAVAAAHAAVAVVRLTSRGRGALFAGGREKWGCVKIQSVFRGYLARKALRALKGLVILQALVRGYLVRKRATETLRSMQALIRAQTAIRAQRASRSMNNERRYNKPDWKAIKSMERYEENRSDFHSQRLSGSYDSSHQSMDGESPKIVEIDTCRQGSRSRRMSTRTTMHDYGDDQYYFTKSSSLPRHIPSSLSLSNYHHCQNFDSGFMEDDYHKYPTAQSTPRFSCSGRVYAPAAATPSRSVCGDVFFVPCPNYMSNTQSFRDKLRSHSAPKQRPESLSKKLVSLNEVMGSRMSFSGARMQRDVFLFGS